MDERPVECWLCGKKMYYRGNPKWEPEFLLVVEEDHRSKEQYYVHQSCWKILRLTNEKFNSRC